MSKGKRILAVSLISGLLIRLFIPTSMTVHATELSHTLDMVIDELVDTEKGLLNSLEMELIADLYEVDAGSAIILQSLHEYNRLTIKQNKDAEIKEKPSQDSYGDIWFKSIFNTGVSLSIDSYIGDDKSDYSQTVEKGESAVDLLMALNSDDPDKWLQVYLSGGDLASKFLGKDVGSVSSGAIWKLNSNLWGNLMKTEEYQEFKEKHKDDFGKAFWTSTWNGLVDCMSDLPRELAMIGDKLFGLGEKAVYSAVQDYQSYARELAGGGNYSTWMMKKIRGELKPTTEVNVYKPNIYLYADNEVDVTVDFMQEELLTVTIPQYINEWNATVHGDGSLTCEGTEYDFLFYESKALRELVTKESGWLVKADEREERLLDILSQYDFNEKETSDFMEFWMDKLEPGVDYIMYPQITEYVDAQMPVEITPMPDSITRLWFGFEQYTGQNVEIPVAESITREGFTVVEWGGFLLDE